MFSGTRGKLLNSEIVTVKFQNKKNLHYFSKLSELTGCTEVHSSNC
jgi:hypothetical protein